MRKRSVTIDGHRTSISLEDAFWAELVRLARQRPMSLNMLVAEVDRARTAEDMNLSSALRVYVLGELVKRRDAARAAPAGPLTALPSSRSCAGPA